jgi:hypothetical protein
MDKWLSGISATFVNTKQSLGSIHFIVNFFSMII